MKKTILKCVAIATFALLLAFNVTTTLNSTDFSLGGLIALASGTSGGGGGGCKMQAFQQGGQSCFICVNDTQGSTCTSSCGSKICWQ